MVGNECCKYVKRYDILPPPPDPPPSEPREFEQCDVGPDSSGATWSGSYRRRYNKRDGSDSLHCLSSKDTTDNLKYSICGSFVSDPSIPGWEPVEWWTKCGSVHRLDQHGDQVYPRWEGDDSFETACEKLGCKVMYWADGDKDVCYDPNSNGITANPGWSCDLTASIDDPNKGCCQTAISAKDCVRATSNIKDDLGVGRCQVWDSPV